ncbi:hypothetical protein G7085_00690 [Tessaracoccus sp. HDW20]|uniref:hypothetical protein n=1 Tax=Tessaracoccus coleopterorum TaxID=2714950 RepID=UPI0018D4B831|nr:hypothetical protein [Tessaracoccus coleopterorum]NHB83713.1 hypothetical protein [Tessaracoccus coleopterorum]
MRPTTISFHEEDEADQTRAALEAAGHRVEAERERFLGRTMTRRWCSSSSPTLHPTSPASLLRATGSWCPSGQRANQSVALRSRPRRRR